MLDEEKSLKKSMAVGAVWVTVLRLSYRLIGLVSTVILARLLTPEDFGIAAIAMSIYFLISTFSNFGFETVLVQHPAPTTKHYSTAWTLNMIFGVFAAALLASVSGLIGGFYEKPEITYITIVISLMFILNGIKNTGIVDFQKNMNFDKEFKLNIIPKFISFFITIGLAVYCRNYWALVIGSVFLTFFTVVNSYYMHPFRPTICFERGRELFQFSKWLMINNFITFINTKSPELILGKLISPQAAAIYSLSAEIGETATSEVISNINRAVYPGYAKVSSDLEKLRSLYQDSVRVIAYLALPLGAGVAVASPAIIPLALGDQWLDAIEPLFYLAIGGGIYALKSNSNYIYYSLGKPRLATLEMVFRVIIFIPLFLYFVDKNGVVGAAQSFMISAIAMFFLSNVIIRGALHLSLEAQIGIYFKPFLATMFMAIVVYWALELTEMNSNMLDLALAFIAGVMSYVPSIVLFWVLSGKKEGPEKQLFMFFYEKVRGGKPWGA